MDISLARSTNSGATFGAPMNLSNNPAASWYPEIAVQGSNVYVAWNDLARGVDNVSFTRSTNNATSFSSVTNVSPNSKSVLNVGVKASFSNVYLIWDDVIAPSAQRQVFFSRSTNNGASFGPPMDLSKSTAPIGSPQIWSEGDEIFVAWYLQTGSVGGHPNFDVVFAASGDGGGTFTQPTNITLTPNNRSVDVKTVIMDRVAYMTWSEGSVTDADILFCTGVLYEPPPFLSMKGVLGRPPELPYKVDYPYVPPRPGPSPPGPPPPFRREQAD